MRRAVLTLLAGLIVLAGTAGVLHADLFDDDPDATRAWAERLRQPREVVDQVVVCFDAPSFIRQIGKWDETRFWPVLLWDSDLVPGFVAAFRPAEVLLARPGDGDDVTLERGLAAVQRSWGADNEGTEPTKPAAFLHILSDRERAPLGVVLLDAASPEFLGGLAVAAGRFHLPLPFTTAEKHDRRIPHDRVNEIRSDVRDVLGGLGIAFEEKFDDLDFLTVANDMPFGYTIDDDRAHPGGYTVDDVIARNMDLTRWGWVGRLVGGPARSVFMAMSALFLQPEKGLFFSRYNPENRTFGVYDPKPALEVFDGLFPTEMIRHPDATLERWRSVEWPEGNPFGFVFVNSSGGATNWSTSKGGATHFDVPRTVPCVVHYTHSGSAGRPFHVDTIAGRWMTGGAYVYFGSYSEPYLTAFVPASTLAERVRLGVPLGAAMRHPYGAARVGQRKMKVGGEERLVRFNLSGPWKLAYFGDPSYQLLGSTGGRPTGGRSDPDRPGKDTFPSIKSFRKARPKGDAARAKHALDAAGAVLLDLEKTKLVDAWGWGKVLKTLTGNTDADAVRRDRVQREMVRVWIASMRRSGSDKLYATREIRKLRKLPKPIRQLLEKGAASEDAGRCVAQFAKEYVSGIARHLQSDVGRDSTLARWALEMACSFAHSKGSQGPFYAWVVEASRGLGVAPDDIREAVLEQKGIPESARKGVADSVKGALDPD